MLIFEVLLTNFAGSIKTAKLVHSSKVLRQNSMICSRISLKKNSVACIPGLLWIFKEDIVPVMIPYQSLTTNHGWISIKLLGGPLQALKKVDFVVTNSSIAGYLSQLSEIRMLPNFMTMGYGPLYQIYILA